MESEKSLLTAEQELNQLFAPIKARFKYTIFFDLMFIIFIFKFSKKYTFKRMSIKRGRVKGVLRTITSSFGLIVGFFIGNLAIMNINPFKFHKQFQSIMNKQVQLDEIEYESMDDFMKITSGIFDPQAEKKL